MATGSFACDGYWPLVAPLRGPGQPHATAENAACPLPARMTSRRPGTGLTSAPQQSAKCATHQAAADRAAQRAADLLAEIGGDAAHHLVGDLARDIARDH